MKTFKTVEWEPNNIGDKTCSEFIKTSNKTGKRGRTINKTINKSEKRKLQKEKKKSKELDPKRPLQKVKQNITQTLAKEKNHIKTFPSIKKENAANEIISNKNESKLQNNDNNNYKLKKNKHIKKQLFQIQNNYSNSKESNSKKWKEKLKETVEKTIENPLTTVSSSKKKKFKDLPLRERMMMKLKSARFRYLNEQIYSNDGNEAQKIFVQDPDSFKAYHEGYRQQVGMWPMNPLDVIISSIKKMSKKHEIGDFGCGEANLSKSVIQKVHSFDLVASNEQVTACNMAHVPLDNCSLDVAVFCLSLMGTNLDEYLIEANRVLKNGGILKIAEVESRFENVNEFIEGVQHFNFKLIWKDLSHNLFYFMDFKKETDIKNKKKLPKISLHPCLYKKR